MSADDSHPANPHRPVYVERVNAAIDFIEQHLGEDLTLDQVAGVAHFSPYHFHRVFGLLVGETLGRFIARLRMERAATRLVQQPARSITEIASECGLTSPSSFARSFREMFGMSATQWRTGGHLGYEDSSVLDLLAGMGAPSDDYGILDITAAGGGLQWEIACGDLPSTVVEVVDLPDLDVAYVRHTGRYQGAAEVFDDIFNRLMTWAGPRGFISDDSWVLAVYHDNPGITDDDKLRVSACIDVPAGTAATGQIGRMRLPGGKCAVARFELGVMDYAKAWFAVAGGWLPDSGYEPDDRLPFERYPLVATETPKGKEIVEIYMPVRPLRAG